MYPTHSPSSTLPARNRRSRRLRRVAVPVLVTSLVGGGLAAAFGFAGPASGATNSITIGGTPVALNQPTDPELATITPSADAATNGMYGSVADWPIIPLHAAVARDGHVISWGTPLGQVVQSGVDFDDWDTTVGLGADAHTDIAAMNGYDSFCNAAVTLEDGRLLMVSGQLVDGHDAEMMSMLYDPTTGQQNMGDSLAYERWYPTALRLTDNRILLLGGAKAGLTGAYLTPDDNSQVAFTPEIGTGTGAWSDLTGAASTALFGAADNHWWYPRAYNAPNGGVVGFSGDAIWTLDPTGNGSVQQVGTLPYDPKVSGSQVMYAPGQILIAGGGQVNNGDEAEGTSKAAVLDVSGATPVATQANSMHFGRNWLNLTVLPTGDVFANGGTIMGTDGGDANSVKTAEIWSPKTGDWTTAATAQETRTYHSTSMLLPSGAVFTGGGGNPGPVDNFNSELYYPSYLFTTSADGTVRWASRPTITSIAGSATYGGDVALTIGDGRTISSASLITLPTVTHSQNTDQRRIPLDITQQGGTVTASLPGSVNTMPPGDYELSVVDAKGVPSPAQIITIRRDQAGLVTLTAAGSSPVATDTGTGTGTGTGTATGTSTSTGTGTGTATGSGSGTATGAAAGKSTSAASPKTIKKNSYVTLSSSAKTGYVVGHATTKAVLKKASSHSSKAVRQATSWIVRSGLSSKNGYSLESVDKPGYYLAAPVHGPGSLTLVKKSTSKSFAKRATFTLTAGVKGSGSSFRLTSNVGLYLQSSGSTLVVRKISESASSVKSATFTIGKGLVSKR